MVKKMIHVIIALVSIFCGVFAYLKGDVEAYLWSKNKQAAITQSQIDKNKTTDYTGKPAGKDIVSLKTITMWDKVLNNVDYVTVTPKSIQKTNVYTLAPWEDYYTKRRNGTSWRQKATVKTSPIDYDFGYLPYYIIELPDGHHIFAQMNRSLASEMASGQQVQLPLGQKKGMSQAAKTKLSKYAKDYNVSTKYVFYSLDNTWQKEHAQMIFYLKIAIGVIVFFIIGVVLELIAQRFLNKR